MIRLPQWGLVIGVILTIGLLTACGGTITVTTATNTPAPATTNTSVPVTLATNTPGATAGPSGIPVQVFYSKHPNSDSDFTFTSPVNRVSPTARVGTYALEQLIAGPTASEAATGLYSQVRTAVAGVPAAGDDHCHSGVAFALTIAGGTARMQFCGATTSNGVGDDARVINEISTTLKQFHSTVSQVKICTATGDVFGNESGMPLLC